MLTLHVGYGGGYAGSIIINRLANEFPRRVERALMDSGGVLVAQVRKNLSGPSHSKPSIKGPGGAFISNKEAGVANLYPGRVSGNLSKANMTWRGNGVNRTVIVGPGGLAKVYARIQEMGGVTHPMVTPKSQRYLAAAKGIFVKVGQVLNVRIPARPYMKPAWNQCVNKVLEIFRLRLTEGL